MNKTAKALLIPVAAFAVTVTGASAFNSEVLERAGLTEGQISAFEEARELREDGDREGARDVLLEAGIDMETMHSVREAMHEYRHEIHSAIDEAVENNDYEAFLIAIEGSPLADIINSEEDFAIFKEAHDLKEAGEYKEAHQLMEELGFPEIKKESGHRFGHMQGMMMGHRDHHDEDKG